MIATRVSTSSSAVVRQFPVLKWPQFCADDAADACEEQSAVSVQVLFVDEFGDDGQE